MLKKNEAILFQGEDIRLHKGTVISHRFGSVRVLTEDGETISVSRSLCIRQGESW